MRDRQQIEREMYEAREDLEASLAQLKHAVREKVDVRARLQVLLERSQQRARDMYEGAREALRERPQIALVAGGIASVLALVYVGRRREWW